MARFVILRIMQAIPMMIAVVLLVFLMLQFTHGDPVQAIVSQFPVPSGFCAAIEAQYHLNNPLWRRLLQIFANLLHGDLGFSYQSQQPVADLILAHAEDPPARRSRVHHRCTGGHRHVQAVFQDPAASLNPRMRVQDTIAHVMVRHGLADRATVCDAVADELAAVGLTPPARFMARFPNQLSSRQQQRVAIARALALRPRLIIADEPHSSLDLSVRMQILDLLAVDRSFVFNQAHVPYSNPTGYCNAELDKIAAIDAAAPQEQRRALYKQYGQIVARDLNEITLTNAPTCNAVWTKFANLTAQFDIAFNEHANWAEAWLPGGQ